MSQTPSRTQTTFAPPVMEARRWVEGIEFPNDRPLLNVSQAAPIDPPPAPMRAAMAHMLEDPFVHLYGPVLGLPELRSALAEQMSAHYAGTVTSDQICITAGCNQAFAAAITAMCSEGNEVILPTPWYFNHKMWLDMSGITSIALPTNADLLPDVDAARALITPRTKAIALVSPNNPGGVEYPADLIQNMFDMCRAEGIKLMLDETYRDFDSRSGAPHALFLDKNWQDTLVHLYSFSKAYRLTGHRVGALVTSPDLLAEVEKFQDTVAICAPQLGQHAALWGIENLADWVAGERGEILRRRTAIMEGMSALTAKGWRLMGCGAYFAYLEHPFSESSASLAPKLVRVAGVLLLPGTMFHPEGSVEGAQQFRVAFANIDTAQIADLFARLSQLNWPMRT